MSPPSLIELNKVLQNEASDADTYHLRGIANFQSFEFKDANHDFDRAVELKPDWVEAIFHRGIVRVVRGRYDDAIEAGCATGKVSLKPLLPTSRKLDNWIHSSDAN